MLSLTATMPRLPTSVHPVHTVRVRRIHVAEERESEVRRRASNAFLSMRFPRFSSIIRKFHNYPG